MYIRITLPRCFPHKEWKKLPEENRCDFIKTEVERREKECVSYARVWGADKYEVGRTYYQMHTDYHDKVGYKYGLERGDDYATLSDEEQRERIHKDKAVLEAERLARESIKQSKVEKIEIERQKNRIADEALEAEQRTRQFGGVHQGDQRHTGKSAGAFTEDESFCHGRIQGDH